MAERDFVWRRRVGFGDCDPARIAYSGRIPEFALEAIDAFWEDLLDGDGWFNQLVDLGFGIPFVHLEFDFEAPVTPRHPLLLTVAPVALGASSITFAVTGRQDGAARFTARSVSVFVESAGFTKIPMPDRVRAALGTAYPALAGRAAPDPQPTR